MYEDLEKAIAVPGASSLIESFRSIGYNLETAVADIIDNSISAGAKHVWIDRQWRGEHSIITIKDDGCGMNRNELVQAMRPGAMSPKAARVSTDLGRFGLGLKTASFSQCRKLTVLSRKTDFAPVYWTWDLDYVAQCNQWELLRWIPDEFRGALDSMKHGTLVVWTDLDRILPAGTHVDDSVAHARFSSMLEKVKKHLAMTFHRFIEDGSVRLYWCGHEIEAWNPFCTKESKTQEKSTDSLPGGVTVKGYILPHKSNFSSEQAYQQAEGVKGWPAQQGFYVYRGKRLLLAGEWLGLRRKEEHLKLVRIQVDIPNSMDSQWQIDIKKSKAYPPDNCIDQLKAYATACCQEGERVFRHRGKIIRQRAGQDFQPLWLEKKKDNAWYFVVNRDHGIIKQVKEMAKNNPDKAIETLLKFIEEGIPSKAIYINSSKNEESQKTPYCDTDPNLIKEMLRKVYDNQLADGQTPDQAKDYLKGMEPFNIYEDLIDEL